jgi:hypothetical protein
LKSAVDAKFLEEVRTHRLRYACDDCAHFVAAPRACCGNGYPLGERSSRTLVVGDEVVFCKEFEG